MYLYCFILGTYSVDSCVGVRGSVGEWCLLTEALPEFVLPHIKCGQLPSQVVALVSLHWSHILLHRDRELLHIVPQLGELLQLTVDPFISQGLKFCTHTGNAPRVVGRPLPASPRGRS